MAATTGLPSVSSRRSCALISRTSSDTRGASAGVAWIRSFRSPPAKKVDLADVRITPVMSSFSASSRSTVAPMEAL